MTKKELLRIFKRVLATHTMSDIKRMAEDIIDRFFPEVEMPEFKIVKHTNPKYLGITRFRAKSGEKPKIIVELQKSILEDKRTLHRTLAHEMIHVWQYSSPGIYEQLLESKKSIGHGKTFWEMANKMNAVYGDNYITETSDLTDVITKDQEFYVVVQPHNKDIFGVTKFIRPSTKQKEELQRRITEQNAHVFKTKEELFLKAADLKKFGGYSIFENKEIQQKLADMYNQANLDSKFKSS